MGIQSELYEEDIDRLNEIIKDFKGVLKEYLKIIKSLGNELCLYKIALEDAVGILLLMDELHIDEWVPTDSPENAAFLKTIDDFKRKYKMIIQRFGEDE